MWSTRKGPAELEIRVSNITRSINLQNEQKASFVAYQFMMLFGNSVAFWQLSLLACAAQKKIDAGDRDQFMAQKIGTAQFYCSKLLPRKHAHLEAIVCDAKFGDELSFEQT